jgi:hypothetical protein
MQAPVLTYQIFYAIFAIQTVGALIWLAWDTRRTRSAGAVVAFSGSLVVGYFLPPVFNHLLLVWFPSNIPLAYITAFDMRDPLFDFIGYAMYFGLGGYMMMRAYQVGKGRRAVIVTVIVFGLADLLYEVPFITAGMFTYYGNQPFAIQTFPMHWLLINASVPALTGFVMYWANQLGSTPRQRLGGVFVAPSVSAALLFIPLTPIAMVMYSSLPPIATYGAALLAIGICLTALFYICRWADAVADAVPLVGDTALAPNQSRG